MLLLILAIFATVLFEAATQQSPSLSKIMYTAGYKLLRALRLVALGFALFFNMSFFTFVGVVVAPSCLAIYSSIESIKFLIQPWTHSQEIVRLQQQLASTEQQLAERDSERKSTGDEGSTGSVDTERTVVNQPGMEGWVRHRICETDDISEIDLDDETVKQGSSGWEGKEKFGRCIECANTHVAGWLTGKETAITKAAHSSSTFRNRGMTI